MSAEPTRYQLEKIKRGKLTRHQSCARKHSFTQDRAVRIAKKRREETGDQKINAYPCLFCERWHIGHSMR